MTTAERSPAWRAVMKSADEISDALDVLKIVAAPIVTAEMGEPRMLLLGEAEWAMMLYALAEANSKLADALMLNVDAMKAMEAEGR